MPDPRFFAKSAPKTLAEIAHLAGAELPVTANPEQLFTDVAPLHTATATDLTFFDNKKYLEAFALSQAGVCLTSQELAAKAPASAGMIVLLCKEPYKSYALVAQAFYPNQQPTGAHHPRAIIDPTATIGAHTDIAAGAVIEEGAQIGANCTIAPNAVIGKNVIIGDHSTIGANASITHAIIGAHCVIYAGARIGQAGFGFAFDPDRPVKVPQLGRVIIEDYVEVGANSTIDRGASRDTIIRRAVMIDNQVHIAHNVEIGSNAIIVAQVGISGSTSIGSYAQLAGQAGLTGHLNIGKGAKIAAGSGVMRDVAAGEAVGGSPAQPMRDWLRQVAALKKLS